MRASTVVNVGVGEEITYAQPCNEIWYGYECTSDGIQNGEQRWIMGAFLLQ
jgi:hypothetical protein